MPTLRACSRCGSHIKSAEPSCPFCGTSSSSNSVGLTAAAVLMGLAIVSCEKQGTNPPEPEYGVPVSDTAPADDGGAPADDGGAPADDGGAEGDPPTDDAGMAADTGNMVAEPEYGVADPG